MATNIVYRQGKVTVTIPSGGALAVWSPDSCKVYRLGTYPQFPDRLALVAQTVAGQQYVTGTYSTGAILVIEAGADEALYEIGTAPIVQNPLMINGNMPTAGAPAVVNTTATLTAANLFAQLITSTTAAAVTGTLPTGTLLDAASFFIPGDFFEWVVVNTGGANAFTVAAGATHTVVGNMVVALSTSGRFRTVKTAANTFVTYRVA